MKKIFLLTCLSFILFSCSKEIIIESEIPVQKVDLTHGDLSVTAIMTRSSASTTDTQNQTSTCGTQNATEARIGVFYGNTSDAVISVDEADFKSTTYQGVTLFTKLEPGTYTVVAENGETQKKQLKEIKLGRNDVVFEF